MSANNMSDWTDQLDELDDYLDARADADTVDDPARVIPNAELRLLTRLRELRSALDQTRARLAALGRSTGCACGKPKAMNEPFCPACSAALLAVLSPESGEAKPRHLGERCACGLCETTCTAHRISGETEHFDYEDRGAAPRSEGGQP